MRSRRGNCPSLTRQPTNKQVTDAASQTLLEVGLLLTFPQALLHFLTEEAAFTRQCRVAVEKFGEDASAVSVCRKAIGGENCAVKGSIARLASQAAQLDDRWRTLADYATSLNSAFELALDIEEAGRQATDSELETIRQGRQDGPRLLSECEAVLAKATENKP